MSSESQGLSLRYLFFLVGALGSSPDIRFTANAARTTKRNFFLWKRKRLLVILLEIRKPTNNVILQLQRGVNILYWICFPNIYLNKARHWRYSDMFMSFTRRKLFKIASGGGQHVFYFAEKLPKWKFLVIGDMMTF